MVVVAMINVESEVVTTVLLRLHIFWDDASSLGK
jgi:hypothetical protein